MELQKSRQVLVFLSIFMMLSVAKYCTFQYLSMMRNPSKIHDVVNGQRE